MAAIVNQKIKYSLKKNIGINLFTKMLPIFIGVITLPIIVHGLGVEKTGILQIIWSLIGYSSFFDLGLGQALTQLVSRKLAAGEMQELPSIVLTTLVSIFLLGLLPASILIFTSKQLIHFLNVSPECSQEARNSTIWLGISIPAMLLVTCQTGVLQSYQKFNWITWLSLPVLFGNFIAPILMLQHTHDLSQIVAVLVICRFIMATSLFIAINSCIRGFWRSCRFEFPHIQPLFNFGKWVTISNIINPLMICLMDRLFLANLLSARVASYYVVPYGVLQKMTIAPWAIMGVMFPAFSASFYQARDKSAKYYFKTLLLTAGLLLLPILIIVLYAKPLLSVWMGDDFARNSYQLTQLIAIALYIFSINLVPFSLIQAAGKASFTAKLQLIEFPLLMGSLYFNIKSFGVIAAPSTLLGLFIFEGCILQWYALRLLRPSFEENHLFDPSIPVV